MSVKYPETDQTFEALNNLGATQRFVNFNSIYNEVKRIRLAKGLMAEPSNLKGRVRRSLVNDKMISDIRKSKQSKLISISNRYPKFHVKPEKLIVFNEKGKAKTIDIENNKFKLIKK